MATISTLITQLVAKTEPFIKGFDKAEARFNKFQKSLVGKAGAAAIGFTSLDRGIGAIADAMEKAAYEGENFGDALQESATQFLKSIPLAGEFARMAIVGRDVLFGEAQALREVTARLESVNARMGLTTAETARLKASMDGLSQAQSAVVNFGKSQALVAMQQAGATFTAMQRVVELESALKRLQQAEANDSARAAMIKSLEEQAGLWGESALAIDLYKASLLGATAADIEHITWLHQLLDARKAANDELARTNQLMDEGRRVWEQTRSPLEAYNLELERLRKLLEGGAIDEDTFRRAVEQAEEALARQTHVEQKIEAKRPASEMQSPAAIERRFAAGFANASTKAQDSGIQLVKKTDLLVFEARKQSKSAEQNERNTAALLEKMPTFTMSSLN